VLVNDYVSFKFGPRAILEGTEPLCSEAVAEEKKCRELYEGLVVKLGKFERSKELWLQLEAAQCDVLLGCNDNVAGFDTRGHPLGSLKDADLHIFTKEVNNEIIYVPTYNVGEPPPRIEVCQVTFSSLLQILSMDPLHMTEHDKFVCFECKNPFSYFQPGYFEDKSPVDGKVVLNLDPSSIEPPYAPPILSPTSQKTVPKVSITNGILRIDPPAETLTQNNTVYEYRYTTDGSEPNCSSVLYTGPQKLAIKARAFPQAAPQGTALDASHAKEKLKCAEHTESISDPVDDVEAGRTAGSSRNSSPTIGPISSRLDSLTPSLEPLEPLPDIMDCMQDSPAASIPPRAPPLSIIDDPISLKR